MILKMNFLAREYLAGQNSIMKINSDLLNEIILIGVKL